MDYLLVSSDPDWIEQERRKAKQLKLSVWWKNRLGEGKCYYCKKRFHPKELTMDHQVPLVRGGHTSHQNCVPACLFCNRQKQNLPPGDWRAILEAMPTAE